MILEALRCYRQVCTSYTHVALHTRIHDCCLAHCIHISYFALMHALLPASLDVYPPLTYVVNGMEKGISLHLFWSVLDDTASI